MMNKIIDLNKLDKSNWQSFTFEQIATKISKTVQPSEAGVDVYVGLEHIDANDIHIRRKGIPTAVKGGKLRCSPGDVIFGKRRAYQRKAAIVDFEGICSAHAFVFRAIPEVIEPKLFPFFLHSDQFMHRMIDISVGGLSPTINWGDLKHQEFLLPPKEQQAEIAELLWAMDEVIQKDIKLQKSFDEFFLSLLKKVFASNTKRIPLIDVCKDKPIYGANAPATDYNGEVRYIRITDIGKMGILQNEMVSAKVTDEKYLLSYGDFLIARSADTGRAYYYKKEDGRCIHAGYLIKFKLDLEKILPEYLYFYTQTLEYKLWIEKTTRTGILSNINATEFSKMKVPLLEISQQKKTISEIKVLLDKRNRLESKLSTSKVLYKSIINQVF